MKMSVISLACGIVCSSIASANLIVPSGTINNFTGTINSPETASVAGQLNVNSGTFAPTSLTINGNGTTIVSPPGRNGDVFFNGGTITPGTIAVQGFSRLNVNSPTSTTGLSNDSIVNVNSTLGVQNIGSGEFVNSASLFLSSSGVVNTDIYTGSGGSSSVGGTGAVNATNFTLAGALIPGDDENGSDVGTLNLSSPNNVSLADETYLVDFKDNGGSFSADKILVDGSISLGGNSTLIVFPVSDPNGDLVNGEQFVILDATSPLALGDVFANIDEANYTVDDGNNNIIGGFTVGYNAAAGQVYLTYTAIPEPTCLGGLALLGAGILRRSRWDR